MSGYIWEHRGMTVHFPCQPYDSQKVFTEKVLDCVLDANNGLLESPTGTGKTLALLCASIAWLQQSKLKEMLATSSADALSFQQAEVSAASSTSGHRVFYSSRTHSQLAQVMAQLKNLEFPSAVALGSRDQLCVHPAVKEKSTVGEKNKLCNFLVKSKQCEFYNNYSKSEGISSGHPVASNNAIMDIEDLVKRNTRQKICPYYKSREVAANAEFVFLPYNYLLDRSIRKTLPAGLSGALVIVDEAHNVTKVCEESSSLVFDTQQIALGLDELDSVIKILEDKESSIEIPQDEFAVEDAYLVKESLMKLEEVIAEDMSKGTLKIGSSYNGDMLLSLLARANMDFSRSSWLSHIISLILDALSSLSSLGAKYTGKGLDIIISILKTAYADRSHELSEHLLKKYYKMHVTKAPKNDKIVIFNLWCFHPGLAMRSITECGTRALILTSGTLKPMDAMLQELDIPFQTLFSGPHIIKNSQILVRTIPKGFNNVNLLSTFQNRNNVDFLASMGKTILELMKHVSNGMLVFFPSYGMMDSCTESWKKTNIWDAFSRHKTTLTEPRDKHSFEITISEFKKKAEDNKGSGACLMAVCRGKIAEGIDFSGNMARAVIIIGIPFPNTFEPRVKLKREYVDRRKTEDKKILSGSEWYKLEAFRAVNQAVGRVIRHREDYGAIFFLDSRFADLSVRDNLTDWTKENIRVVTLPEAVQDCKAFFKSFNSLSLKESQHSFGGSGAFGQDSNLKRKAVLNAQSEVEGNKRRLTTAKKIVINSTVNNVLRYKAGDVVASLKQKLSKEELLRFKSVLKDYKTKKELSVLKTFLSDLHSEGKIERDILMGMKEFILKDDISDYEAFLFMKS